MGLGTFEDTYNTSLVLPEVLMELSGLSPQGVVDANGNIRFEIEELEGVKSVVDIGAGMTGFLRYVGKFVEGKGISLIEVDPIFADNDVFEKSRKKTGNFVRDYIKRILLQIKNPENYGEQRIEMEILLSDFAAYYHSIMARKSGDANIVRLDACSKISDNSVDLITAHHVYFASNNPVVFFAEIYRMLSQNGKLILVDYDPEKYDSGFPMKSLFLLISEKNYITTDGRSVGYKFSRDEIGEIAVKMSRFSR